MKLNRLTLAVVLCLLLLSVAGWTMSRPATQQWEYRIVYLKDGNRPDKKQDEVNALGSQGWELVSVERGSYSGSSFDSVSLFFKRQKQ
jgi:hypothetical protein